MSLIGLDIGTTGCKAIVFNRDGVITSQSAREYPILTPQPLWAEQDAEHVFTLAMDALQQALANVTDEPGALALSCQGEAMTPVDDTGRAIRHTILGMDTRTFAENEWLAETFGSDALFNRTGMAMHTVNTLPKLLWLKKNEPDVWQQADQFLLYEDFFIRKLTGQAVISHCLASRTQMYDIAHESWAEDILEKCGIDSKQLGKLAEGNVVGELSPSIRDKLGLSKPVLVAAGGHDQACAALGSGVIQNGLAMVSTGTAEVVEVAMNEPKLKPALQNGGISVYKHVVPDLYLAMTLNHSGGLSLRWFRDQFGQFEIQKADEKNTDAYDELLANAPDGPTRLMVLPHFSGSGTPLLDTASKGAIVGLTFMDNKSTVCKALLEGLTFELRRNIDLLRESDIEIKNLHAVGGGAKSRLWLQIKADICQTQIKVPKVTEAACLGAGILAGVAAGDFKDVKDAVNQIVRFNKTYDVNVMQSAMYDDHYKVYKELYPALKSFYQKMDEFLILK